MDVGMQYCWDFARGLGLDITNGPFASSALGGFEVTPFEMNMAYSAFANNGMLNVPRCVTKIDDAEHRTIMEPPPQSSRVMKESTAAQMRDMLFTAVEAGTGTRAMIPGSRVGGKTGTSSFESGGGSPDVWFNGFNEDYTGTVWMGYDIKSDKYQLRNQTGGNRPASLWRIIVEVAVARKNA
jgi:penicillin-binding protein 1A